MIGCVEFPGGFFLGVKDDAAADTDDDPHHHQQQHEGAAAAAASGGHSMLARIQQMLRDTDDVVLVDLTRNLVTSASPRLPVTFKVGGGRGGGGESREGLLFCVCFQKREDSNQTQTTTTSTPPPQINKQSLPSRLRQALQGRWARALADAGITPGAGFGQSNPDHHLDFPGLGALPTQGNSTGAKRWVTFLSLLCVH